MLRSSVRKEGFMLAGERILRWISACERLSKSQLRFWDASRVPIAIVFRLVI